MRYGNTYLEATSVGLGYGIGFSVLLYRVLYLLGMNPKNGIHPYLKLTQMEGRFLRLFLQNFCRFCRFLSVLRFFLPDSFEKTVLEKLLLHFKQFQRAYHTAVQRVKMQSHDAAARTKVRGDLVFLRAGKTAKQHGIGREFIKPVVLIYLHSVDEQIVQLFHIPIITQMPPLCKHAKRRRKNIEENGY